MGAFDFIKELSVGAVVNPVLRERVELAQERYELLLQENGTLKAKLADAEKRCTELQSELEAKSAAEQFVSYRGVLFKKGTSGVDRDPYCPRCLLVMNALTPFMPFRCAQCKHLAPFNGSDLDGVLQEVGKLGK